MAYFFEQSSVSMPCVGLTPFLHSSLQQGLCAWLFQCPVSGLLHFYGNRSVLYRVKERCFNALCRAYSISTLDLKDDGGKEYLRFQCPVSGLLHFYRM